MSNPFRRKTIRTRPCTSAGFNRRLIGSVGIVRANATGPKATVALPPAPYVPGSNRDAITRIVVIPPNR